MALDQLLIAAFYALQNTRLPVLVGVVAPGSTPPSPWARWTPLGMSGLVLANTVQNSAHALILLLFLWRAMGPGARCIGAPRCASPRRALDGATLAVVAGLDGARRGRPGCCSTSTLAGASSGLVYLGALALLGSAELGLTRDLVLARLGRRPAGSYAMTLPATAGETALAPVSVGREPQTALPSAPPGDARTSSGIGATARALLVSLRPGSGPRTRSCWSASSSPASWATPSKCPGRPAAFLFCLLSGAVYLANDLPDVAKDRLHPPNAGAPSPPVPSPHGRRRRRRAARRGAWRASFWLSPAFFAVALAYLALQGRLYVGGLKDVVILDVLLLAGGFVLRAVAGAVVVDVPISPWLYVCTLLLAPVPRPGKRRQELVLAGGRRRGAPPGPGRVHRAPARPAPAGGHHLPAGGLHALHLLRREPPRNRAMMLTIPFVLYGLFRYLYLVYARGEGAPRGGAPARPPLAVCLLLWALASAAILYFVPRG